MEPAQEHAVVGVRRSAAGVVGRVMDLAPGRGDVASRDDASAVPRDDRAPLVRREDALWSAEFDDAAVGVENKALDATGTRNLSSERSGNRLGNRVGAHVVAQVRGVE